MVTDGRFSTQRDFDAVGSRPAICIRPRRFWRAAGTSCHELDDN